MKNLERQGVEIKTSYSVDTYPLPSGGDQGNARSTVTITEKMIDLDSYRKAKDVIRTESLYPAINETSPIVSRAFVLIGDAIDKLTEARESLKEGDIIGSDNAILHVTSILAELFCCRSIGDSFGAMINAIFHSLSNRDHGVLFTNDQISQLLHSLKLLNIEPYMDIMSIVDEIIDMENCGLNVDPEYLYSEINIINE